MAFSASTSGSSLSYVTSCIPQNQSCTLSKHFQGTLQGNGSGACLVINGVSTLVNAASGADHAIMCNVFFPKGTVICASGAQVNMMGCLFD